MAMPEKKREPKLPLRRPCAYRSGLNGLAFAVAESKAGQREAKQCERAWFGHAKSAVGARILKYQILEKASGAFRGSLKFIKVGGNLPAPPLEIEISRPPGHPRAPSARRTGAARGSSRDCPSAPPRRSRGHAADCHRAGKGSAKTTLRPRPVASGPGGLAWSSLLIDNRSMTMDRAVEKKALHPSGGKPSGDLQYWLAQPVQARLAAVEELRRQMAGYDAQPRLQRVCRIT